MMNVGILGAGGWGTAISLLLNSNISDGKVYIWDYFSQTLDNIKKYHENIDYLQGVAIPESINLIYELNDLIKNSDIIFSVVPSIGLNYLKNEMQNMDLSHIKALVSATKGFHIESKVRVSEIWKTVLKDDFDNKYVVLSGPSHAEEVARKKITAVSIASKNIELAREVTTLLSNEYFRAYSTDDIIGVELGGALKNIMAIGAGIIDALELGDNAKAAFITRSLYEIIRFGVYFNAKKETFFGLSGLGDLIVTCNSNLSRNHYVGFQLGKGKKLNDIVEHMKMVAEGVHTTDIVYSIAKKNDIEMPITTVIFEILHGADVKEEIKKLMTRSLKDEVFY